MRLNKYINMHGYGARFLTVRERSYKNRNRDRQKESCGGISRKKERRKEGRKERRKE
jgi:hypothetical protein